MIWLPLAQAGIAGLGIGCAVMAFGSGRWSLGLLNLVLACVNAAFAALAFARLVGLSP